MSIGLVVGLDYANPYLSPFEELQRYKTHPAIRRFLQGGKRIAYGARAIAAGGLQSLPKLVFPGGALIGDDAGFLNAARIKGSHAAMKSGMLAAEAVHDALASDRAFDELDAYPTRFRESWLYHELHATRNFKPWLSKGLMLGGAMFGIDQIVLRGRAPWTLHRRRADHEKLVSKDSAQSIAYPKPDGVLTFDRLSSVFVSSTNHEENQPSHLKLKDPNVADRRQSRAVRRARAALLPGGRVRDRARCRRQPPSIADQRAELRALQDVRHQGSDAEHRLGHAGRRRRAELLRDVTAMHAPAG